MNIVNKRANFDFQLTNDRYEAGISLKGAEARSLRLGRGDMSAAFVKVINGEMFLVNANIPATGVVNYDPLRTRKLLLHRSEIISITTKTNQQKLQVVPVKLYNKKRLVKLQLALGKPKRKFEKKESIKRKDIQRDMDREVKNLK